MLHCNIATGGGLDQADAHFETVLTQESAMTNPVDQFTAVHKANLKALQGFTTQAYAGFEKLVELNLAASKAVMDESFSHAQAVMSAKDPQELMALQAGLVQPMADKSTAYAQHVQSILNGSSTEFTKAVEAKAAEAQKAFASALDNLAKNAPAGTEPAFAAFKTALTAGQNAMETAQSQAKKVVETAQASLSTAATQAADAIKKATKV
jgi:phasin family protein